MAIFGEGTYNLNLGDLEDANHIDLQIGLLFRFGCRTRSETAAVAESGGVRKDPCVRPRPAFPP